ncbi:uncharacterized protein LOC124434947 isoform X2 [Xenia sp. Carnegie-2017]|uniref:uncharacterized protein LOC124434947 isoform X2 n=1 Tax=Xenia sp. Carnegie-2017 TaxID=2897299 RepID=UPI001F0375DC|nr:uncharacterized protein LOC124434947 isoform X2 [Xenia sp. Carnegie-2017]
MSLGIWKKHVKPRPRQIPKFRRGNVPKYISFVEPMPLRRRPGMDKSSGYSSCGTNMDNEDLSSPVNTQRETDLRTVSEFINDLPPSNEAVTGKVDVNDVNQEETISSRASFSESELNDELDLVSDEAFSMDKEQSTTNEEDLVMKRLNTADTFDSLERQSCDKSRRSNFARHHEVSLRSVTDFVDNIENGSSEDVFMDKMDEIYESNNSRIEGKDGDEDRIQSNCIVEDDSNLQNVPHEMNDGKLIDGIPSDKTENASFLANSHVTFQDPVAADPGVLWKDNDVKLKTERPKSILKVTLDAVKSTKDENTLDSFVKRNSTSSAANRKLSSRQSLNSPTNGVRTLTSAENTLSINLTKDRGRELKYEQKNTDRSTSDEERLSDSDFSTNLRRHRPKPKANIYNRRTNMKVPNEKLRKRKNSSASEDDDVTTMADSTLLVEQILEEEKLRGEGMKQWLKGRLALSQQNSRFEIPMDVRLLESMTPMEYLTKHCVISKRRKALYQRVFQKVDRNRDEMINYTELEKGLRDVHVGILNKDHIACIVKMVVIDKDGEFDVRQFSAIAAFSERICCKDQLPVEMLNNASGQKEIIECADFCSLSWKLHGIKVNPDVKRILDAL